MIVLPRKYVRKPKGLTYDFSWIEKNVKKWKNPDAFKDLKHSLTVAMPARLVFYNDLFASSFIFTHLCEEVKDLNDYWRQRELFYDYLVKKYQVND